MLCDSCLPRPVFPAGVAQLSSEQLSSLLSAYYRAVEAYYHGGSLSGCCEAAAGLACVSDDVRGRLHRAECGSGDDGQIAGSVLVSAARQCRVLSGCRCVAGGAAAGGVCGGQSIGPCVGDGRIGGSCESRVASSDSGVGRSVDGRLGGCAQQSVAPLVLQRTLENRAKREKAKKRKLRKQAGVDLAKGENRKVDLPEVENHSVPEWRRGGQVRLGRNGKPIRDDSSSGFWNSCSAENRQRLIDTKAEMHIAENERKTREARNRVKYLDSAQACVDQVMQLMGRAQEIARKEGNERMVEWAKAVTDSSAESLARSAPTSSPSFESISSKIDEANKLEAARLEEARVKAEREVEEAKLKEEKEKDELLADRNAQIVDLTRHGDELREANRKLVERIEFLSVRAGQTAKIPCNRETYTPPAPKKKVDPDARRPGETVQQHINRLKAAGKFWVGRADYMERNKYNNF